MTFINNISSIYNRINFPNVSFRSNGLKCVEDDGYRSEDSFSSNPVKSGLISQSDILQKARSNPRIMSILKENNIPLQVNISELENLQKGHLATTRIIVAKMYSALSPELKEQVNLKDLQEAAMFHDYGKVFIPKAVLNKGKNQEFTPNERKIMNLHSELGYELLKDSGLSKNALNLIKYHHQTLNQNGYPEITDGYVPDVAAQILWAADRYSALIEQRSYKDAMTKEETLNILKEDALEKGIFSEEVYNVLCSVV